MAGLVVLGANRRLGVRGRVAVVVVAGDVVLPEVLQATLGVLFVLHVAGEVDAVLLAAGLGPGLVHDPARAAPVARFKLYGHLAVDSAAYERMADAWPDVAAATAELSELDYLVPSMAALDVDAEGRVVRKLYLRTVRALDSGEATAVVHASGGDEHGVLREAAALGLERFWSRRVFVCRAVDHGGRAMGPARTARVGHGSLGATTSYAYDLRGRLARATDPLGGATGLGIGILVGAGSQMIAGVATGSFDPVPSPSQAQ